MEVYRTIKYHIKKTHPDYNRLKQQCVESKEIYNFFNYALRQLFFKNSPSGKKYNLDFIYTYPELTPLFEKWIAEGAFINYQLRSIMYKFSKLKNYILGMASVGLIYENLKADWTSFWRLLKMKQSGKYNKDVSIPGYKKDYNAVEFGNQQISLKKLATGYIVVSKYNTGVKVLDNTLDYRYARAYYYNNRLMFEVVYKKVVPEKIVSDKVCSIDLGLVNLFTVAFNYDKKPITFSGAKIMSVNQYFNKKLQYLQYKNNSLNYTTKAMKNLQNKRTAQIREYVGQCTNQLISILRKENISKVVIGYTEQWKDIRNTQDPNSEIGITIPMLNIVNIVQYKLEDIGIECIIQDEKYTSQVSYIDGDKFPDTNKEQDTNINLSWTDQVEYVQTNKNTEDEKYGFSGYRINRNLYQTKDGKIIDADINAALNLLRKANIPLLEELTYLKFDNIFKTEYRINAR